MAINQSWAWDKLRQKMCLALIGPHALAFFPAGVLGVYWVGGEISLIGTTAAMPLIFLALGGFSASQHDTGLSCDGYAVLLRRDFFNSLVDQIFEKTKDRVRGSALFHIRVDDYASLIERHGQTAADTVVKQTGDRILMALRDNDIVSRLGDCRFAICLGPSRHMDLEVCIQMAGRMQKMIEEPVSVDGVSVYVTAAVGFCLSSRTPETNGAAWAQATSTALREAQKRGPSTIRAYTEEMRRVSQARAELREEVGAALDGGQITPWYQPQISTDTGNVTGFEALARWHHPERGMIAPADFLPAIEQAGLLERLAEVMMYHSFTALKAWDASGVAVPQVGVNFSGAELNNPRLVEKIKWEMDRFNLAPPRLSVEVLETVIARVPDDQVTLNINGLVALGCRVDLDDFGTGHASISSIRRFKIDRLKIDRSFVMKADRDPEQQRMISAILTMAERLGLETLAEGVETVGEHALLAQLGCDHVQGFGIGKPMPFNETLDWIHAHEAKLQDTPKITGRGSQ
jgi:diguanylate cyclase (GGDEF)-like protein